MSSVGWQGIPITDQHIISKPSTSARPFRDKLSNCQITNLSGNLWVSGCSLVHLWYTRISLNEEKTLLLQIKAYRCHINHCKHFPSLYKTHVVIQLCVSVAAFSWSHSFITRDSCVSPNYGCVSSLHELSGEASGGLPAGRAGQLHSFWGCVLQA